MAENSFPVSPSRIDPYKNFKFRLSWNGHPVAGFQHVSNLTDTGRAAAQTAGAGNLGEPSQPSNFPAIVLEGGVTHDPGFEAWAGTIPHSPDAAELASKPTTPRRAPRKDLTLELQDDAGRVLGTYTLPGCWVSGFEALPGLENGSSAVHIQSLKLENGGRTAEQPGREAPPSAHPVGDAEARR